MRPTPGTTATFAAAQPATPAPAAPVMAAGGNQGNVRVPLAALLKDYTAAELGFDPVVVPNWIMTSLPYDKVREQMETGNALVEVGLLIDGVTDIGFRNVLATAKRDYQIRLPANDSFQALAQSSPATLPNLASIGGDTRAPAPPASMMRAEPSANGAPAAFNQPPQQALHTPVQPIPAPSAGGQGISPFTSQSAPAGPVPQRSVFTTQAPPVSPPAPPPNPFAQMAQQPAANAPAPAQPLIQPVAGFRPFAPPAPVQPAAPQPAFPVESAHRPAQDLRSFPQAPEARPEGFGSAELLSDPAPAIPEIEETPKPAGFPSTPSFTSKTAHEPAPASFLLDEEEPPAPVIKPRPLPPPSARRHLPPLSPKLPAPRATPRTAVAAARPAGNSLLGLEPIDTSSAQMLLHALLCTDEDLHPQRVVELTCALPGIAACICIDGDQLYSHCGAHKPQARDFERQAADMAHHLRSLAPLIGIATAETFTLNAGDRLITFCFPRHEEGPTFGVLHDDEPSMGLREKITLIARELSVMLG